MKILGSSAKRFTRPGGECARRTSHLATKGPNSSFGIPRNEASGTEGRRVREEIGKRKDSRYGEEKRKNGIIKKTKARSYRKSF